jgi:hypothetical protein
MTIRFRPGASLESAESVDARRRAAFEAEHSQLEALYDALFDAERHSGSEDNPDASVTVPRWALRGAFDVLCRYMTESTRRSRDASYDQHVVRRSRHLARYLTVQKLREERGKALSWSRGGSGWQAAVDLHEAIEPGVTADAIRLSFDRVSKDPTRYRPLPDAQHRRARRAPDANHPCSGAADVSVRRGALCGALDIIRRYLTETTTRGRDASPGRRVVVRERDLARYLIVQKLRTESMLSEILKLGLTWTRKGSGWFAAAELRKVVEPTISADAIRRSFEKVNSDPSRYRSHSRLSIVDDSQSTVSDSEYAQRRTTAIDKVNRRLKAERGRRRSEY